MVNPLPEGAQPLIPHLIVKDCAKAIEFYKKVFLAEEMMRMPSPDGKKIMHAELNVSGCHLYLCDEWPDKGAKSPQTLGGSPVTLMLYCLDADKVFHRAVSAGAKVVTPLEDAFWGDRYGKVKDPFGHEWMIMTRKENLTPKQMMERSKKVMAHA
jgi:PhnB protein